LLAALFHGVLVLFPFFCNDLLIFIIVVFEDDQPLVELVDLLVAVRELPIRRLHIPVHLILKQIVIVLECSVGAGAEIKLSLQSRKLLLNILYLQLPGHSMTLGFAF